MPLDQTNVPEDGPLQTEGYVCNAQGAQMKLSNITLPPLTSTMVEVKISMIGLCHTDIHMKNNDWGISNYPILPGHEAVGVVTRIGASCRKFSLGDKVGIAWIRDSCRLCSSCEIGRENLCESGYKGTFLGTNAGMWGVEGTNEWGGCFARVQRIEERFAVKIPDNISTQMACPLMCAGATVFEPLCDHAKIGGRIGVIGLGGLGTIAIKLAKVMGCYVVAISSSPGKREGVLKTGADAFVDVNEKAEVDKFAGSLDLLIDTRPVVGDVGELFAFVKFGGVVSKVGIPEKTDQTFQGSAIGMVFTAKSYSGSVVTGTRRLNQMFKIVSDNLEFMKDNADWSSEKISIDRINEAMNSLLNRKNKAYRYVLAW